MKEDERKQLVKYEMDNFDKNHDEELAPGYQCNALRAILQELKIIKFLLKK